MADIVGAERSGQGSAWLDVTLDDGTRFPIEDPSGEEERRIHQLIRPPKATSGMEGPMAQAAQAAGIDIKPKAPDPLAGNPLALGAPAPMGPPLPPGGVAPPVQVAPVSAFDPAAQADLERQQRSVDAETQAIARRNQAAPDRGAPSPLDQAAGGMGLTLIRKPGTRGGFQPSTRGATVQGPMAEDREAYLTGIDRASMLRQDAGQAGIDAQRSSSLREGIRGTVAAGEARQKIADIGAKVTETERIRGITSQRMNAASKVPENPMGLFERSSGWFTVLAVIAAGAGAAAQGASNGRLPNNGLDAITKLLDMDVQAQRANKSALLQDYERQLGDSDAALSLLRADMAQAVAKETEAMKRTDMAADQIAGLSAISKALLADAAERRSAAEAATMRTVSTQESERYVAGTPGGIAIGVDMDPMSAARLESAGGQKALKELEAAKLGGEGSATVGAAVADIQEITATKAFLSALAEANGGVIPTTGLIDFDRSDTLRNAGARLGFKGKEDAAKAISKLQGLITRKARSYGGPITDSDVGNAIKEVGTNTAVIMGTLDSMLQDTNNRIGVKAGAHAANGDGQILMQQLLQRQSFSGGVPGAPSLKPR